MDNSDQKYVTVDGLEFCVDTVSKEATLVTGSYRYSGDIKVPEKITDGGVEYTVTALGDECFSYCSGLTSITIPSSVTRLGYSCFEDCTALTSIDIPSSVTSLGDYCFHGCSGLTSIDIPSSVTSLDYGCFIGCTGLLSIICENPNPPSVGSRSFDDDTYSNSTLYVPDVAAYQAADGWLNFKNIKKIATDDISAAKMRGVVVAAEGGIVTVSGLSDGAKVEFYSIDGKLIGAEKANSGTASIATSEHVVICKVGRKSIKILVK